MTEEERRALRATVHYAIGKGDDDGTLSHAEEWHIADVVVSELVAGKRHTTSSLPYPFRIEVKIVPTE